jgi:hypothetical protein
MVLLFILYWFFNGLGNNSTPLEVGHAARNSVGLGVLAAAILISGLLYGMMLFLLRLSLTKPLVTVVGIRGEEPGKELYNFTCLVLNFATVFIYYTNVYDPKETWRPAWTERLG